MSYTGSVPAPRRQPDDWRTQALCARPDMADYRETFFPHPGETAKANLAKQICAACPVRAACLEDALRVEAGRGHENRHGVRGGLSAKQRYARYTTRRKQATA